jgi:hypothetical protein
MFIPNPDYFPSLTSDPVSRISDPGSNKKGEKNNLVVSLYFSCFNWQRILVFLTPTIFTKLSEIWVGSGVRKKLIPDPVPEVKKASDPGSGSVTLVRQKF